MGIIVQKFGGTSVADAEKIHRAARRAIRAKLDGHQVVLAVSAMGKTTDQLIDLARQVHDSPPKREMDMLLTTGEQISIALMAMAIHAAGHEAISLTASQVGLVTDSSHTKARIQEINIQRIRSELDAGRIAIVAGFQGTDARGEITTMGRGASDTTAVALAAVLGAELCEIYTDVDGVYTTDPRIVPQARKIDRISYNEMLELASLGAGVMHSRAIEFGLKYNVPIHVRSSLTDTPGTMIVAETEGMEAIAVRGATLSRKLARVFLKGVPNEPGMAARIFAHIGRHNVVVDDIIQVSQPEAEKADLGFTVNADEAAEAKIVCEDIAKELGFDAVEVDNDVAKVSVVGIGMRTHTGVAAKMFGALADGGISIEDITTSEIVIGCLIRRADADRALQLVHKAFALDQEPDAA
jgi:aspartate kinase